MAVSARVPSSDTKVPQQEGCRITELTSQVCLWLADWAVTISTGHRTRAPPHLYYSSGPGSSGLPSALSALEALEGPPSYLTPEATRPLASSAYHGRLVQAAAKASSEDATGKRDRKTGYAPGEWDITKMAPKLKGQAPPTPAGVVSAAAVRYKTDDRVGSNIVTAAQVAMLGGQWASSADATEEGSKLQGPQPAPQADANLKRKSTSAMGVQDFLDKGHGGAQLPRKKQDRKDMEKSKRERGQSSHAAWKSEAEMVLRQQYD
ncbi:TPA: hypothetical protein ACH3X3_000175 [Trebouxia sp. C0006]